MSSEWCYNAAYNFYNGNDKIGRAGDGEIAAAVYNAITSNADVIKAVFCGHWHNEAYTEIKAHYYTDGKRCEATIPQYVSTASVYCDGYITVITVR